MKVTIKDCLELPVFHKAKVLAGNLGLENRVRAVSFFEAGDLNGIMQNMHKKNEMILTSSFF